MDHLPVLGGSDRMVRAIGADDTMHADFGSGLYEGAKIGIPFVTVGTAQEKVPVRFEYADESDPGPYPVPPNVPIEGGRASDGDRHVIVVDRGRCRLYELYAAYPHDGGSRWTAGSGAIWNLKTNRLRPRTWTSADAAGLPILPGLARWDEVKRGRINHALRFTVPETRREFIYPARHFASDSNDPDLPAMGQRFRLKANYPIDGFPRQARIVLTALKRYGMIVADNGSAWYVTGAPNRHWDNDALHTLGDVPGRAFEVVDTSKLPRPVIHHVTFEVRPDRIAECVAFYSLLGFEQVEPPASLREVATWVQGGPTQVHLMHVEEPVVLPRGHVAVVMDDWEASLERLRSAGHSIEPRREHWGSPRAFVRDPAGNLVELMEFPP